MTIGQARKILGDEAKTLTDKEVLSDIEMAELLKDLFFNNLVKNRKSVNTDSHNVP